MGSAMAFRLYQRAVRRMGEEAAEACVVAAVVAGEGAGVEVARLAEEEEVAEEEEIAAVAAWLRALTASDVSVMITFRVLLNEPRARAARVGDATPHSGARNGNACHAADELTGWPQAIDGLQPGMVRCGMVHNGMVRSGMVRSGMVRGETRRLLYRIAVVDVQPKPPSKVTEHFQSDQRLVRGLATGLATGLARENATGDATGGASGRCDGGATGDTTSTNYSSHSVEALSSCACLRAPAQKTEMADLVTGRRSDLADAGPGGCSM